MSNLERRLETPLERIAALDAEVLRLRAENEELCRRLGLTSENSHKPPAAMGRRRSELAQRYPKQVKRRGAKRS